MGCLSMVFLDTCALLCWTLSSDYLSAKALEYCNKISSDGASISSITIWEVGIKIKKGILNIGEGLEAYVARLKSLNTVNIIPVDENIWIKNLSLKWSNNDPADRTIVATAMLKKLPIITKDKIIRDFYPEIIW